tara:strand:+ start:308 stop:463 length:156 start_codon:yes stop_codon:yes gene_type:complete
LLGTTVWDSARPGSATNRGFFYDRRIKQADESWEPLKRIDRHAACVNRERF